MQKHLPYLKILIFKLFLFLFFACSPPLSAINAQTPSSSDWYMAGANPERTSWVSEEVRGKLYPLWYKPFEAYILPRTQIVTSYNTLYIATSKGLYALDADTGNSKWVYPTEFPLADTPTVDNGVVYIGGFDKKMHAIDAYTGNGLWTFESAGAGFQVNPLVVDNKLFAGNRDGYMYAIHTSGTNKGKLAWKYKTDGPITISAAYKDGVVYFASNDMHAYALNANSGNLVWKSDKLLGYGFHSWWPVIYNNYVIFAGSHNYRRSGPAFTTSFHSVEMADILSSYETDPRGTKIAPLGNEPGDWVSGTTTMDLSKNVTTPTGQTIPVTKYYKDKPWRRTYFVLSRSTGKEVKFDLDKDGKSEEYAPILWFGNDGANNRYPPVISTDGVLYQYVMFKSDPYIPGGNVVGWKFGTPHISIVSDGWAAVDEGRAVSGGGNLIYSHLILGRNGGAVDISKKLNDASRSWSYFSYNLPDLIPGYNESVFFIDPYFKPYGTVYGNRNGSYGYHGDYNPIIPYDGKVLFHSGNAVIAFSPSSSAPKKISKQNITPVQDSISYPSKDELKTRLESEIQKIIAAGHLRPGYGNSGIVDSRLKQNYFDDISDYWHHPSESIYILLSTFPHISSSLRNQLRNYIQNEFSTYPPYEYNHIGWKGEARETIILPPEIENAMNSWGPEKQIWTHKAWRFNPFAFYSLYKYAKEFGGAKQIFDTAKSNSTLMNSFDTIPSDDLLSDFPYFLNAYIAGYYGYLELEKLAGYPTSTSIKNTYDSLLSKRIQFFSKDLPDKFLVKDSSWNYQRTLSASRNFIFMTPELADYLRANLLHSVTQTINETELLTPYWFVPMVEVEYGEGTLRNLYDSHALFQARARILNQPYSQLARYLDVPAFPRGDLYYIHNLAAALETGGPIPTYPTQPPTSPTPTPPPSPGDANGDGKADGRDFIIWLNHFGQSTPNGPQDGDFDDSQTVGTEDYTIWVNNYSS